MKQADEEPIDSPEDDQHIQPDRNTNSTSNLEKDKGVERSKTDEEDLSRGIDISLETISKIQTSMKNILGKKETDGIKFFSSNPSHRVFEMDNAPGLIFKLKDKRVITLGPDDSMKARYNEMIKAQTIVRTHKLGLLVIPNAKLCTVKDGSEEHEIIVEKKLDINSDSSIQEEYFEQYADKLNETIRQLAVFICKTGFSDVEWRNIPILNNSVDEHGNRRIALVDIEDMDNAVYGLYGNYLRRGLLRCVNEEQGKIVVAVAKEHGIVKLFLDDMIKQRQEEIEDNRKLKEYHLVKSIVVGNEPVAVDQNSLDFSEYGDRADRLKTLAKNVIDTINRKIAKKTSHVSIKERRSIYINPTKDPFYPLSRELLKPGKTGQYDRYDFDNDEDYRNATFIGCVVKKLTDLKAIYQLKERTSHSYLIQA